MIYIRQNGNLYIFSSKSFYTYTILSISSKFDKIKEHSKRRITSN